MSPTVSHWLNHVDSAGNLDSVLCSAAEMSSDSRESLDHSDPPLFLSLDTSLDIKTVISKVLIPVLTARLKI